MRFLKAFCTTALITTCLSTSGKAAAMMQMDFGAAKQHASQYYKNHPINALKGHSPFTGNDAKDTVLVQNPEILNDEKINAAREEFNNIRRNQTIWALVDSYGIDPSLTHFPTRPEEYEKIDPATATARINEIVTQISDPAFTVVAEIRTALSNELFKNVLALAMKGNTIAAQFIWQNKQVPGTWCKSFFEQDAGTRGIIQQLSDTDSAAFKYLLARSLYIATEMDNNTKMGVLADLGTDAATDYWGVLRYVDLISRNDTNTTATADWLDLFQKIAALPLGQHIAVRPLQKKDGTLLPRGYIDALRQFSGMPESEPMHRVLRAIVEKTKAQEIAECYIAKYTNDFPDTKSLDNETKIDEIKAICEIVPQAKSMLARIINASIIPGMSLGYFEKNSAERRSTLTELAVSGSPAAQGMLAQANAGTIGHNSFDSMRKHLGYEEATDLGASPESMTDYLRINQERTANILYLAFRGSKTAQDLLLNAPALNGGDMLLAQISATCLNHADGDPEALTAVPVIESKSILQFNLEMLQTVFGHAPAGEKQAEVNKEAPKLLKQQFDEINILSQANDFTLQR